MRPILTLLVLALHVGPAVAAVSGLGPSPAKLEADAALQPFLDRIVGLDGPLFDAGALEPVQCAPGRSRETRGLFIAAGRMMEDERGWLEGPRNDAELFRNTMILRGARPENLVILEDGAATREGVARAALALAGAAGCGDSVVLHFSGFAFDEGLIGLPDGPEGPFSSAAKTVMLKDLRGSTLEAGPADAIIASGPFAILNFSAPGRGDVLSAAALSELVTVIRNRGADVAVILDTASAETFAVETRQARLDARLFTHVELAGQRCAPDTPTHRTTRCVAGATWAPSLVAPNAGQLTIFYSSARGDAGVERRLPAAGNDNLPRTDTKVYGFLSFQLATAMAGAERTTVGALARRIAAQREETLRYQSYSFVATDPDLDLIAEIRPDKPEQQGRIIIDTPETTRAAAVLESAEIAVAGRVLARGEPIVVEVNGAPATITATGGFEARLELQAGVNVVEIFAVTRRNEAITHRFELFYEGDIRAVIGEGRRYAVLIANQDYADGSGIADLATPIGDAEALAKVLTERYGFVTEAALPDGRPLNLFLKNAGQRETGLLFDQLARIVGERDSVVVFYAGHGEYETSGTAYWLPADAMAGSYSTFIDAGDITRALNRLAARNVLVISDSCYSGMLLRSTDKPEEAEAGDDSDRLRMLQRLASKRSRLVISSGGNEPVLDGGADGHSVFAHALLSALEDPEETAFAARELFGRLVPRVSAVAAQTPDFRPIYGAGHDGGDFVFLATAR